VIDMRIYVAWHIEDPYAFFVSLGNIGAAENRLRGLMGNVTQRIGNYNFDQIINVDPEKIKLAEIEQVALEELQSQLTTSQSSYGISVKHVGIKRIMLPGPVTEKVFERMRDGREALAQQTISAGESEAISIRAEAEAARERILTFAQRRAQMIRAEGDREAGKYIAAFAEEPELAIFLRQVETLRQILGQNTQFILDAKDLAPFDLMGSKPGQP